MYLRVEKSTLRVKLLANSNKATQWPYPGLKSRPLNPKSVGWLLNHPHLYWSQTWSSQLFQSKVQTELNLNLIRSQSYIKILAQNQNSPSCLSCIFSDSCRENFLLNQSIFQQRWSDPMTFLTACVHNIQTSKLCDNGNKIAKHKFQNHQFSFLHPFHAQKFAPFSMSFTTVVWKTFYHV